MDDLTKLIEAIDENTKLVNNITSIAKNVIAKNPDALDNTLVQDIVTNSFGVSVYEKLRKSYQEFIGT